VADVTDKPALQAAAAKAVEASGGFDTWVNDAGAFSYGRLDVVKLEDQRRLL
jgi:NADP-dependent 3-hydroxy acid dehydrogenase YdfG